jgi:hypothetical protein
MSMAMGNRGVGRGFLAARVMLIVVDGICVDDFCGTQMRAATDTDRSLSGVTQMRVATDTDRSLSGVCQHFDGETRGVKDVLRGGHGWP